MVELDKPECISCFNGSRPEEINKYINDHLFLTSLKLRL